MLRHIVMGEQERRGFRSDLACEKCDGRTGRLHIREASTWPGIGRACDSCGHIQLDKPTRSGHCAHGETEPVYKRTSRAEGSSYRAFARRCTSCKRLL